EKEDGRHEQERRQPAPEGDYPLSVRAESNGYAHQNILRQSAPGRMPPAMSEDGGRVLDRAMPWLFGSASPVTKLASPVSSDCRRVSQFKAGAPLIVAGNVRKSDIGMVVGAGPEQMPQYG
ncbi:hypothetical protein KAJ77_01720, partial [bacterium]|nr:hypothetical protein [bacterium]